MTQGLKIIIAEDEYLILAGLKASLLRLGHQVIGEAKDGSEAVKLALELRPDLMLLDINMPKMDGIQAIKSINQQAMIPAIIISGYCDRQLIDQANEAGVFGYLVKPINEGSLRAAIDVSMARFREYQTLAKEYDSVSKMLADRKYIERAKGILMERNGLKESEAMKVMQQKSRNSNTKLVEVAKAIIKADEMLKA